MKIAVATAATIGTAMQTNSSDDREDAGDSQSLPALTHLSLNLGPKS